LQNLNIYLQQKDLSILANPPKQLTKKIIMIQSISKPVHKNFLTKFMKKVVLTQSSAILYQYLIVAMKHSDVNIIVYIYNIVYKFVYTI